MADNQTVRGIVLCVFAFACFSISDAARKYLSIEYGILDILMWQGIIGCSVLLMASPFLGGVRSLYNSGNAKWHFLRGGLMAVNTLISLLALSYMPIMDAYTIYFTCPFVTSMFSALIFKEPLGRMRMVAIMVGFAGGLVAFRPGFVELHWAYLFACMAVFTFAFSNLVAKRIGQGNNALSFGVYPLALLVPLCLILNGGVLVIPSQAQFWIISIGSGIIYAHALIWISKAFQMGEASLMAPYQYTQLFWALIFGYFVFGDVPDIFKMIGAVIIIGSGIFFFMRERRQKLKVSRKIASG